MSVPTHLVIISRGSSMALIASPASKCPKGTEDRAKENNPGKSVPMKWFTTSTDTCCFS